MFCQICVSKIKKDVKCTKCNEIVCKSCFEMNIEYGKLHCMFCSEPHDIAFLKTNLNERQFKSVMKRKLYDDVETYTKKNHKRILQTHNNIKLYLNEINTLNKQNQDLRKMLGQNTERCRVLKNKLNLPYKLDEKTNNFMYCCDVNCENILTDKLYCEDCCVYSCINCLCTYSNEESHECKDKESITLMLSTSKQCPSCNTYISKIDGCNQMWCVFCKTAFSWSTGLVLDSSRITYENPHRTDYLRSENKGFYNRGIYYMDERPSLSSIRSVVNKYIKHEQLPKEYNELLMNMKRNVMEIPHCMHRLTELIEYNSKTDISTYASILKNTSNEEKQSISKVLYKKFDKCEKYKYQRELMDEYITCVTDKLILVKRELKEQDVEVEDFYKYYSDFDIYNKTFNENISMYKKKFKCVCHYQIDDSWQFVF